MPQEMPKPQGNEPKDIVNLAYLLAQVHACCFTPFIRSGFGTHAFRPMLFSALLMAVYAEATHTPLLEWYLIPWFLAVVVRRVTCNRHAHSRWQGNPWVFGWLVRYNVARTAEVFILFFAGVFAATVSESLAAFVLAGIVSLLVMQMTEAAMIQGRRRAMRDAQHEAAFMNNIQRGG